MKRNRWQIALTVVALVIIIACIFYRPIPAFTRAFIIPYAVIGILMLFLFLAETPSVKREVIISTTTVFIAIATMIAQSGVRSYIICLAIIICIIVIRNSKYKFGFASLISIVTVFVQYSSVSEFYNNYQKAISGIVDVPAYVPGLLRDGMYMEAGMFAVIIALDIILFSATANKPRSSSLRTESVESNIEQRQTVAPIIQPESVEEMTNNLLGGIPEEQVDAPMTEDNLQMGSEQIISDVRHDPIEYCRYCGKSIPSDSVFCPYCGKKGT